MPTGAGAAKPGRAPGREPTTECAPGNAEPNGVSRDEASLGQLEAVHRLSAATVAATTLECICQAALDTLISSLPVQRAAVLLYDSEGVMRFKAWRGLSDDYRRAAEGHSPWTRDEPAPRSLAVPDAAGEESLGALREVVLSEGIGALAFIPLLYGNRLLGKFMLYCDRPHDFSAGELALAETIAGHIAFALEKRRLEDELRLSADTLSATLNAVGEGITVQAPDGTLLLANQAAAAMLGFSSVAGLLAAGVAEVAARFQLLDENGEPLPPDRLPGRAALRGHEPPEVLVRWRVAATEAQYFSLVRAHPVRDEAGAVRFAVNVFRDVTERQLALEALRASEARLAFLASASRRLLATPLDPRGVLEQAVDLVVPELADAGVASGMDEDGRLERIAVGHRGPDDAELVSSLERCGDLTVDLSALGALREGRSVLLSEIAPEMVAAVGSDADHGEALGRLGIRSAMLVPLRTRQRTVGVLTLAGGAGRPPYGEADVALAEELAGRVASTLENARAFAREHAAAETLARALLPGRLPEIPGLQLAARYQAAGDVGGDFYDCFPIGVGSWMLVVGDVCGRGIQAASMTGLTRHTIRAAALHASSPAAVLADLNRLLLDAAEEEMAAWLSKDRSEPSFCTVCLAVVTPQEGGARGIVATAGHPLPLLLRRGGAVGEIGRPGSLLGVVADVEASEEPFELGPGDALVLFTDGISERRHSSRFFDEDLPSVLAKAAGAPAPDLAYIVEEAAVAFATAAPDDDMAVLVLSVPTVDDTTAPDASGPALVAGTQR